MEEKQVFLLVSEASINQLLKAIEKGSRAEVRSAFVLGTLIGGTFMAYLGYKVAYKWMIQYQEEKRKNEDAKNVPA